MTKLEQLALEFPFSYNDIQAVVQLFGEHKIYDILKTAMTYNITLYEAAFYVITLTKYTK